MNRMAAGIVGDTLIWTADGLRPIRELAGTVPRLLVVASGASTWQSVEVHLRGQAPLVAVALNAGPRKTVIRTSPELRWLVWGRPGFSPIWRTSQDLRPRDRLHPAPLAPEITRLTPFPAGIVEGVAFGLALRPGGEASHQEPAVHDDSEHWVDHQAQRRLGARPCAGSGSPDLEAEPRHLYGWLAGYFSVSGTVTPNGLVVASTERSGLTLAQTVAMRIGMVTGDICRTDLPSMGEERPAPRYELPLHFRPPPEFLLLPRHRHESVPKPGTSNTSWTIRRHWPLDVEADVYGVASQAGGVVLDGLVVVTT
jgi:hypothetical protein